MLVANNEANVKNIFIFENAQNLLGVDKSHVQKLKELEDLANYKETLSKRQEPYTVKHGTVRISKEIGGEKNINNKLLEWPSDEYLNGLSKEDFENLKITSVSWIRGSHFGPDQDYCHAFQFKNNLNEESPAYTSKKETMDSLEFGESRIAKVSCKTNGHHVYGFKFYDDFDKKIGQIFSNYDKAPGKQHHVTIGLDETLIGFAVRQSDWVDCKTAKVTFKIAQTTNGVDEEYRQRATEYQVNKAKCCTLF